MYRRLFLIPKLCQTSIVSSIIENETLTDLNYKFTNSYEVFFIKGSKLHIAEIL